MIRGGYIDPMAHVSHRLALGWNLGLHLTLGISHTSDGPLQVFDAPALLGFGYRVQLGDRLRFDASAQAGYLLHHYDAGMVAGPGNRAFRLASLVFTGGVRLSLHITVEPRLASGYVLEEYFHPVGNAPSWSRSRLRTEVGVGIALQ